MLVIQMEGEYDGWCYTNVSIGDSNMVIQLDTIEALKAKMKEAPEVAKEKRSVSKQEAIRELKREIQAMQKRGYTLDDIAKFMSDGGLQISTPTLKSYLQRSKADRVKGSKETSKQPAAEKTKPVVDSKQSKAAPKGSFQVRQDSEI